MFDVIAQSALIQLGYAMVAMAGGFAALAYLDHRLAKGTGIFAQHFKAMEGSPVAFGVYFGARFLGVCWVAAAFLHG